MSKVALLSLIVISFLLCGCMQLRQLAHLDKLLALQDMSNNRDMQTDYVEFYDANFEKLLNAVKDGTINEYKNQESFRESFGDPLYVNEKEAVWMYRYSLEKFNPEKVYLYFDESGNLKRWEHVKPRVKAKT